MKTLRRFGQGDLEHVRHLVLQVALLDNFNIVENTQAAFALGDKLGMMVRVHLNLCRLHEPTTSALLNLYFRNLSHQLEMWDLDDRKLEEKLLQCELIVQSQRTSPRLVEHEGDASGTDLEAVWLKHGGRLLGGNHHKSTLVTLEKTHPSYISKVAR
jgi:hypothetical protein